MKGTGLYIAKRGSDGITFSYFMVSIWHIQRSAKCDLLHCFRPYNIGIRNRHPLDQVIMLFLSVRKHTSVWTVKLKLKADCTGYKVSQFLS